MSLGPLYDGAQVGTPGLVRLTFRIQAQATTSAPDFIYPSNAPVTSAKSEATGVYTIKFNTAYPGFVGGICRVMPADTTALGKEVLIDTADYSAVTGQLIVYVTEYDNNSATDGDVNAAYVVNNDWLYFDLVFVTAASDAVVGALAALA